MRRAVISVLLFFVAYVFPQQLFEGDIILTDDVIRKISQRGVAYDSHPEKKWPGGIIPYVFHSGFGHSRRKLVAQAIEDFEKFTCIRFIKRTNEVNYLRFIHGSGCSSFIGKHGNTSQDVSIGHFCDSKGNTLHEMMHAIGFYHEQSRRDRDQYVEILWDNIPKASRTNFMTYLEGKGDTLGEPYDFDSIMHYKSDEFGIGGRTTIRSIKEPYKRLGQRIKLSDIDIRQMNKMYNCPSTGRPLPSQNPIATNSKRTTRRPSVTKPIKPVPCDDKRSDCAALAKGNGCTSFWKLHIMQKDCRQTCKLC